MVKKIKHAGLLLITDNNRRAVILQANKSYNENVNRNLKYNKHIPFVEKLSIPRGRHDIGEKDYETALREFIEETGLVFDKVHVYKDPFVLEWEDNTKMYKYVMFIAILAGTLYYLNKRPNTYNIRLRRKSNTVYAVDLLKHKFRSQELVRRIELMNLKKYIAYMENRQLSTYKYSNYDLFFNYIYNVVSLYTDTITTTTTTTTNFSTIINNNNKDCNFFEIDLTWFVESEKYNFMCY